MVLLMLASVVGAIAVTWVLNRTFLEDYYLYSKMDIAFIVFFIGYVLLTVLEHEINKEK